MIIIRDNVVVSKRVSKNLSLIKELVSGRKEHQLPRNGLPTIFVHSIDIQAPHSTMTVPRNTHSKPEHTAQPAIKSWSVADILAAGGADDFALSQGVNPKQVHLSGMIQLSQTETDALQAQLRE